MNKFIIELSELEKKRIQIGYEGEQNHTQVIIRCGAFFAKYPDATAYMTVQTQTNLIYPVELEKDGSDLIWDVSPSDVSIVGTGKLQLTFTDGSGDGAEIIKSAHGSYDVLDSLDPNGDAPDPIQHWIDKAEQTARQIAEESAIYAKEDIVESYGSIAPAIIETASGAIASISDGADGMLVKKMTVGVDPVQDLHGQDSPYPPGGGKNIFDISKIVPYNNNASVSKTDDSFTVTNGNSYVAAMFCDAQQHTMQFPVTDGEWSISIGEATTVDIGVYGSTDGTNFSWLANGIMVGRTSATFTVSGQILVEIRANAPANGSATIKRFQFEKGNSATSYAPYSNVCPISGWTEANVSRTGKNLYNASAFTFGYYSSGGNWGTNTVWGGVLIPCSPGTVISVSGNTTPGGVYGAWQNNAKTPGTGWVSQFMYVGVSSFTAPAGAYGFWLPLNKDYDYSALQIEYGSSATAYEAFNGSTTEYEFPQAAGTVYGGTLTIHQDGSGELVADRANIASYNGETLPSTWISDRDVYAQGTTPTTGAQVVYELATPVTYQLTNQQVIALLKGSNNILADTGNVAVEYPADTKLYIDGKVAELQALILENISNS